MFALALGIAGPANALSLTWNTCKDGTDSDTLCSGFVTPSARTSTGSGTSQTYTFDAIEDASQDLVVRAFRTTSNLGTGTVLTREITIWEGGLGAGPEGSPEHAVDNVGPDEMLVFQLPADNFTPKSFRIGYKSTDADISTWIGGTLGGPGDALNLFLSVTFQWTATGGALTSTYGYVQQNFLDVVANVSQLFTNGATGRYLIIGARNEADGSSDGGEDKFKLMQVVADQPVPEPSLPGTLAFLASGLAWLAVALRKRG